MLYPINTDTRVVSDLSGIWKFKVDDEVETIDPNETLPDAHEISVPGSFNDQIANDNIREHVGYFWYQTDFNVPNMLSGERQVLRFGSATQEAWVYVNGKKVGHHKGGFTPFEMDVTEEVHSGKNKLSVHISNMLDSTTLPVGKYSETEDKNGKKSTSCR